MASISNINQELVNMQSATAVKKAQDLKKNGASQELDGNAFLMLMMEQLKNQDPMDPMDNSEMLAQQAQFTQIQEMQKLNEAMSQAAIIQQANSLVGKTVQVVDPNNTSRLITGLVSSANFGNGETTITVNGQQYPLGYVASVTDGAAATENSTLLSKKLSELNGAADISEGYVYLTMRDASYNTKKVDIKITKDMTVKDFIKKVEDAGVSTTLEKGVLKIHHGNYKSISLTQGKTDDSSQYSNFIQKTQMFQNENNDLETAILDFNR